jgi:hypothetical protein
MLAIDERIEFPARVTGINGIFSTRGVRLKPTGPDVPNVPCCDYSPNNFGWIICILAMDKSSVMRLINSL